MKMIVTLKDNVNEEDFLEKVNQVARRVDSDSKISNKQQQGEQDSMRFNGDYEFLSNFYEAPIIVNNIPYRNTEAAFQSFKLLDKSPIKFV